MTDLRYFLAGRELREKFHRTERQGVMSSFRLRPCTGALSLGGDIIVSTEENWCQWSYLSWRRPRKLSRTFTTTP